MTADMSTFTSQVDGGSAFWVKNAARTRWFDGLSLLLPAAEALIVDTMEEALSSRELPEALAAEIRALRQDERRHQVAHEAYNARLAKQGLPLRLIESQVAACLAPVKRLPLASRVRLLAVFEQCTALVSAEALRSRAWLDDSHCHAARMWRWHCEEEVAHHQAMLRLARCFGQRALSRLMMLPLVAATLALDSVRLQQLLLAHDAAAGRLTRWRAHKDRLSFFVAVLPSMLRMVVRGMASVRDQPA